MELLSSVLTEKMDSDSKEFKQFQDIILEKSREQTASQKRKNDLTALKIKMEDYLNSKQDKITLPGEFLREFLKTLKIQQKKFAEYLDMRPSNLSKVLSGERPINSEMALVLGEIFDQDPMIWLNIQTKNELTKIGKSQNKRIKKHSLEDLI